MNKPWYKSKTKVGAVLIGGGLILVTLGKLLRGEIYEIDALISFSTGFGLILVGVGLRDAISKG